MYNNLKTTLFSKGISVKQYAEFLGVGEKTVQNKMRGVTDFTYPEFKQTCKFLLPEYNAEFLFTDSSGEQREKVTH